MRSLARPIAPALKTAQSPPRRPVRAPTPGIGIDARLPVSRPEDHHEQEAERAAEHVMAITAPDELASEGAPPAGRPQRDLRTAAVPDAGGGARVQLQGLSGDGAPLDARSRSYFEPRFARDFSNVRIHDGPRAAAAAATVHARAFALGRDIFFAAGAHAPTSESGRRLLAHELAHVVQQCAPDGGGSPARAIGKLSRTPVGVHRAPPAAGSAPVETTETFEETGNEAGAAGARRAAASLDRLISGPAAARALQTIPITDPAQKQIVIEQVLNSPAVMRAHADRGRVRELSTQEFESGQQSLGFPATASAFADADNDFVYITRFGSSSAFVMGHEFSHIQTGPVVAESADPELALALGNLNTEVRAAYVDYAILQLGTLQEEVAAGMPEDEAVAAFSRRYAGSVFDYVARHHGSVAHALDALKSVLAARRGVENLPTHFGELKRAIAKGYVAPTDLELVFSREVELGDFQDPFEMAAP